MQILGWVTLTFVSFIVIGFGALAILNPIDFYCTIGCHRWSHPGGHCEDCGLRDNFFD